MENKKYIATVLALTAFATGIYFMVRNPVRLLNVATWPNDQHAVSRTIYDPDKKRLSYVDKIPFGSLDYVIDHTSSERIEREPNDRDRVRFSELEKEAKLRGLIPKK